MYYGLVSKYIFDCYFCNDRYDFYNYNGNISNVLVELCCNLLVSLLG